MTQGKTRRAATFFSPPDWQIPTGVRNIDTQDSGLRTGVLDATLSILCNDAPMTAGRTSPSIDRRRVGALLRTWREERKIKAKDAAAHIGIDATTLGRIERGAHGLTREKIVAFMELYDVEDEAALNELIRAATEDPSKQWWYPYRTEISRDYLDFITLESQATDALVASGLAVPGILQCAAYAQEMQENALYGNLSERAEIFQTVRIARQRIITRTSRETHVQAVFAEGALQIKAASMPEQVAHLIALSRRPNVEIRVVPQDAPLTTHSYPSYSILDFSLPWVPVLHLDSPFGGMLSDEPSQVNLMRESFDFVCSNALSASETQQLLIEQLRKTEQ